LTRDDFWFIIRDMTIQDQEIALAQHLGYEFRDEGWRYPENSHWQEYKAVYYQNAFVGLHKPDWPQIPNYGSDLNVIAGVRKKLLTTPKLKYTYTNHLRDVISQKPETPRNKLGQPLVSDFDIVNAEAAEHLTALVKTLKLDK